MTQPTSTPCPHCGQSVYVLATTCWHCKQPLRFNPPLERGSREAIRAIQGWEQLPLQSAEQSATKEGVEEQELFRKIRAAMPEFLQLMADEFDQLDAWLKVPRKMMYDIGRYARDANYKEEIAAKKQWIQHLNRTREYNRNRRRRDRQPDPVARQLTEGASKEEELSPAETVARDFLLKLRLKSKRATGKQIVAELKKKHIHLSEPTLRRHVLPRLMRICGVKNDRDKRGYYIP